MNTTKAPIFHTHTPLWDNSQLPELHTVPDQNLWTAKGILFLSHVLGNGIVRSFQAIKDEFGLSNRMLFHYLQL